MILFIDACVRQGSRTRELAQCLLEMLPGDVIYENIAEESFPVTDEEFITRRSTLSDAGDFSDPIFDWAKRFAMADLIIVAAPYWDLSFPACLKKYFEMVSALGVTFRYENDIPRGMCRAKKLYYVTTAGGSIFDPDHGYGYVRSLCSIFYGIKETAQIKAENLDIEGSDARSILEKAKASIEV